MKTLAAVGWIALLLCSRTADAQAVRGAAEAGAAQVTPASPAASPARPGRLRVFIDCGGGCYEEYVRDNIKFVDFVRQAQDADVHLLSSSTDTGGGGREIVLRFVGRGRFTGHDEELRVVSLAADTVATRRELVLRTVQVGLLAFMAREGIPADLSVDPGLEDHLRHEHRLLDRGVRPRWGRAAEGGPPGA